MPLDTNPTDHDSQRGRRNISQASLLLGQFQSALVTGDDEWNGVGGVRGVRVTSHWV